MRLYQTLSTRLLLVAVTLMLVTSLASAGTIRSTAGRAPVAAAWHPGGGSGHPNGPTSTTVGSFDSGNCYPFMCNDSGTNVGVTLDYQEAFTSSAFSGPLTVTSMSWYYWPNLGPAVIIGGNYTFYWGYSAFGLGLTSNLASNYNGAATLLGTATIPAGGQNFGTTLTLSGFAPFTYNPANGDLLLEIVASNQDIVPNNGQNGYNWADYGGNGPQVSRAYCLTNSGCLGGLSGALDTTFTGTSPVPEPGSLALLGSGVIGLAGLLRRKLGR